MPRVLVTAGGTRNPIDAIRSIAAGSTGQTGLAIARGLARDHEVIVLGSEEARLRDPGAVTEVFTSTRDLYERVRRLAPEADAVVHSAAVGDYEVPASDGKIPSGQAELTLRLTPTPKILDEIRRWAPRCFLVSFKAGSPDWDGQRLEHVARAQLGRTRSDLVLANRLGSIATTTMLIAPGGTTHYLDREEAIEAVVAAIRAATCSPSR